MAAVVMAALAGLLGIIIGRFWDGRSESSRWRRDQTTQSYQRLAEAFSQVYEHIRVVALAEPGTSALAEVTDRARQDKTWDNALAAVWLHGSTNVIESSLSLDREVTKIFHRVQKIQLTVADWNAARTEAAAAFEHFIEAAREELRLPFVAIRLLPDAAA
ncbi:hypothetical protein [Amycolatopsis sp. NPDC051716]|jgi:hypothetical protein|uniref:hypothetical protein n=1 Tax=Amycolatopsis sp. NPDC051716 TaxID=3155804 RepID=UPI00341F2424